MNKIIFFTLLLVASALAEQPAEISSPHQDSAAQGPVVPVQPSQQSPPSVVVSNSAQPVVVSGQPAVETVHVAANEPHHPHGHPTAEVHHHANEAHHHHHHHVNDGHHHVVGEQGVHPADHQHHHHPEHQHSAQPGASYYSPAGLIQVIGNDQVVQGANKPVVNAVRNFEQYGQPESASIPANYKPFGSWGLYIGGNPADGYYTNYYKALSSSVDKQQPSGVVEPVQQVKPVVSVAPSAGVVSQTAAFSPVLRQASSSAYVGADYYPFAYSQSDLNTHHSYQPASVASPQPYSSGALVPEYPYLSYADQYATKRLGGSAYQQKEVQVPVQQQVQQQHQQQLPSKGYQQRLAYASYPAPASVHHQPAAHHQQVVSYPVPVGSQIVGSQPGVDGAFNPYGIHAFTRYAVKPTVVNSDSSYYTYSYPSYRQQSSSSSSASGVQYQPFSFYGYPLSQLHYSQGSIVPTSSSSSSSSSSSPSSPSVVESPVHHVVGQPASSGAPVDQVVGVVEPHQHHHHHHGVPVEAAASEKAETSVASDSEDKKKRKS